jgi:hypothetical protein
VAIERICVTNLTSVLNNLSTSLSFFLIIHSVKNRYVTIHRDIRNKLSRKDAKNPQRRRKDRFDLLNFNPVNPEHPVILSAFRFVNGYTDIDVTIKKINI